VGISPPESLTQGLNTFALASPIAVQSGDRLGLRLDNATGTCVQITNDPSDVGYVTPGFINPTRPSPGQTETMDRGTGAEVNVAATFRPSGAR